MVTKLEKLDALALKFAEMLVITNGEATKKYYQTELIEVLNKIVAYAGGSKVLLAETYMVRAYNLAVAKKLVVA